MFDGALRANQQCHGVPDSTCEESCVVLPIALPKVAIRHAPLLRLD